jgi:hypothetical protein
MRVMHRKTKHWNKNLSRLKTLLSKFLGKNVEKAARKPVYFGHLTKSEGWVEIGN